MGCLYSLESPSGKSYIGITSKTATARWATHQMRVREGRNNALQQAIKKYGAAAFTLRTLAVADDWDYLCDLERKAIVAFGTLSPGGYNLTAGGEGVVGRVISEESRERCAAAQRRRFERPEERARMVEYGIKAQAALLARAEARRVNGKAPWQVRKMNSSLKAKLGESGAKLEHSIRTKAAMAKPDVAEKVRAARRLAWQTPGTREKLLEGLANARAKRLAKYK